MTPRILLLRSLNGAFMGVPMMPTLTIYAWEAYLRGEIYCPNKSLQR